MPPRPRRWAWSPAPSPPRELDAAVADACAELQEAHPQGLRETKALLARDLLARIDAKADDMAALCARLFGSDGAREAMTAFLRPQEVAPAAVAARRPFRSRAFEDALLLAGEGSSRHELVAALVLSKSMPGRGDAGISEDELAASRRSRRSRWPMSA